MKSFMGRCLGAGEGSGTPLQYSCLENLMDGGAWWAAVHGVAKSRTRLSDFTFTFHFHALEKEIATHSSVLALRTPRTREPGGLPSMGSHRVRHDLAAAAWEPVFLIHVSLPLVDCKLHEGRDPTCIIHHCVSSTPHRVWPYKCCSGNNCCSGDCSGPTELSLYCYSTLLANPFSLRPP